MQGESERVRLEFMDTVYRGGDRKDVDYYIDRASSTDGPVLELGCGTGRIYLALLEAGIDADGIDLSADALAVLRETAEERGLEPSVWQADMTDVAAERHYALVTCPFNAIQKLTTLDEQQALLESVFDMLEPGGVFIFDTFVPDFEYIAEAWDDWHQRTVEFRGEAHEYHTRSRLTDEVTQAYSVEKKAMTADGEQLFFVQREATLLSYREIELLARQSPFDAWSVTGDFTDETLTDGHSTQVWTLERIPA